MATIDEQFYPTLYKYAKDVYNKAIRLKDAKTQISNLTGVKGSSAQFYIYTYKAMINKTLFKGNLSAPSAEYFLEKIHDENSDEQLQKALDALMLHIEYYKNTGKTDEEKPLQKLRAVHAKYTRKIGKKFLVNSLTEIVNNIRTFERYLVSDNEVDATFAGKKVLDGICFICYEVNKELRFAPSKFIGYRDNTSNSIDGRHGDDSNQVISRILGSEPILEKFEMQFRIFTSNLGITVGPLGGFDNPRKFWPEVLDIPELSNGAGLYDEGNLSKRKHRVRERNSQLIKDAKDRFKKKHGHLFCEVCNFNFSDKYGVLGDGFIEAHHTIPVSKMKPGYKTYINEIAMVCSNCHRMIHTQSEMLSIEAISKIVDDIKASQKEKSTMDLQGIN